MLRTLWDNSEVLAPRSPAQEETTDFLSRLRRCLPCPLGRGAPPPESSRPCFLPLRPCYGSEPGKRFLQITCEIWRLAAFQTVPIIKSTLLSFSAGHSHFSSLLHFFLGGKCFCLDGRYPGTPKPRNHTALKDEGIPVQERPETGGPRIMQL